MYLYVYFVMTISVATSFIDYESSWVAALENTRCQDYKGSLKHFDVDCISFNARSQCACLTICYITSGWSEGA